MLLPRDLVTWVIVIQKTKAEHWISQSHFLTTINPFFESFLFGILSQVWHRQVHECFRRHSLHRMWSWTDPRWKFQSRKKSWGCVRKWRIHGTIVYSPTWIKVADLSPNKQFGKLSARDDTPDTTKKKNETRVWRLWFFGPNLPTLWMVDFSAIKSNRVSPYPANVPGGSSSLGFEVSQTFAQI